MTDRFILEEMYKMFRKPKVDWMGFPVTENNPITYHHIVEKANGGEDSVDNGALLSEKAHQLLHRAQIYDPALYKEYNYWFRMINDMKRPPSKEIVKEMKGLRKRLNGANAKRQKSLK